MLNVYCWKCGTRINEGDILGLGHFDQQIGKYKGKGFIVFNCPNCKKARYQIINSNVSSLYKIKDTTINEFNINQVIDFYSILKNINSVDSFLERCAMDSNISNIGVKKPIVQPLDVYHLFCDLNKQNMRRLLILTLDKDNFLIDWEFLGERVNRPISLEPRTIFRTSFLVNGKASVIIAENLNKPFTRPSQKDILMTKRLIKAGKLLGVDLLDYIVIEDDCFHSYDQLNYI